MISTYKIYEDLRQTLDERAAQQIARHLGAVYEDIQQTATKSDLAELRGVVHELAEAQQQTNATVRELAQAQKRTEERVGSLELAVERLAQAQQHTDLQVRSLAQTMEAGFWDLHNRFGVLGSRWDDRAEETFRGGLLETVSSLGYTVEHYQGQDPDGFINHDPGRSYDLDVLIHDGDVVVAEIKSNASGADVTEFHRSVLLYEQQTGRKASKRILVAVTLQEAALKRASQLGVILATDFGPLSERK
jgi:hypothetical protein